MNDLLRRLIAFMTLADGAEDQEDPPEDQTQEDPALDADPTDDLADILDEPEPTPPKRKDPRDDPYVQRLERELADARRAPPQPAAPPARDIEWEREEQQLREAASADENTRYWVNYKIQNDRKVRALEAQVKQTTSNSQDSTDQIKFRQLELTKPKLYARYHERVEEAARTKFPGVPREIILKLLVGEDTVDGKIKPKAPAQKNAQPEGNRVDRGRTPVARSDVRRGSGGGMTEHEKRIARLRNQYI